MAKIKFYYMPKPAEGPGRSKFQIRFAFDGYDSTLYDQLVKAISNALRFEEEKEAKPSAIGFHADSGSSE